MVSLVYNEGSLILVFLSCNVQRFVRLKAHQDKSLVEAEENLASLRSIAAAKDKKITQLEK
ncbi:hypothetical protein Hanom_Chr06g00521611 [Helianthus anomalus]